MILQLKVSHGKGRSDLDMKEATKQGLATLKDPNEFGYYLQNFWALRTLLFGENGIMPNRLKSLMVSVATHTTTFEAMQIRDENFCTKLAYVVDTRTFRWLESCGNAIDREEVDDEMIDFRPLILAIKADNFIQDLPTTFNIFKNKDNDIEADYKESTRPSKKLKREQSPREEHRVNNPNPIKE